MTLRPASRACSMNTRQALAEAVGSVVTVLAGFAFRSVRALGPDSVVT